MSTENKIIVVAGATGNLGGKIASYLLDRNAKVRALVRSTQNKKQINDLIAKGAEVIQVDYTNPLSLTAACINAHCVVSALSGVRDVIVDAQTSLLNAANDCDVFKFIPSDFCTDYRKLIPGNNRNLDLRREFSEILTAAPIKATSVLNGMFTDLLISEAPVILFNQQRIFFWGNADQQMDFTTIENTAQYTADAVMDDKSPRWLTIAGESASMRDLQKIASEIEHKPFKLFRPGGLSAFKIMIKITKTFAPGRKETFPAWQGMQYLYDMLTGLTKFESLDNNRYQDIQWTRIEEVLLRRN